MRDDTPSDAPRPGTTEHQLNETISLLRATLDSTADGILVVDREGKIVSFNLRFLEMWRIPEPIIASRDDSQALGFVLDQVRDPEAFLAKVRELYNQPDAESFDVLEFKDGRTFERYSRPQRVAEVSVGRVWSFRDVSARRQAEEALRRNEEHLRQISKLEAIGQLAGGIAHDFNNLLMVIKGYTQLILSDLTPADPLRRNVEEIQKASDRAATLTQQLLAFSRRQVLQPRVLDLNVIVADVERILQRLIGEDVNLACFPGQALGRVLADPNQIEQVLMNLAVNARDAMPRGGRLTIETQNVDLDDAAAARHVGMKPGPFVMLAVSDNGLGMDAKTQTHIFDPFFTTKEQGKGTGLGLSTAYGIVKQSGGYIFVQSEVGRGSAFKIYLPRVERATDEPLHAVPPPPAARPAEETILLVEDEEMVRELVRQLLVQQGYTVLTASGGAEALTLCQRHPGPIHLLLTDVVMPQMSGRELSIFLASIRPEARVLYMSGYTDDAIVHHGVLEPGTAFIQKPFTPEALEAMIRKVLGSPRKPAA